MSVKVGVAALWNHLKQSLMSNPIELALIVFDILTFIHMYVRIDGWKWPDRLGYWC